MRMLLSVALLERLLLRIINSYAYPAFMKHPLSKVLLALYLGSNSFKNWIFLFVQKSPRSPERGLP